MKWRTLAVLSIFVFLLLILGGCATESIRYAVSKQELRSEGLKETPEVWEDGYRTAEVKNAFEWWYFDASFDDGSTAVIVFSIKPITDPSAPISPSVSIVVTTPQGKRLASSVSLSGNSKGDMSSFFSASTSRCEVKIGDSYVVGNLASYRIVFDSKSIKARLRLDNRVGAWRPGSGIVHFGDRFFAWFPAVPYGRVSGKLYYGGRWHSVSGSGYHDHNWGTVRLQDALSQWYWGRAHIGNYTLIFSKMFTTKRFGDRRLYVFFLAEGRKILIGTNRVDVFKTENWRLHPEGREYPADIRIFSRGVSGGVEVSINNPRLIESMSLIAGLPPVIRAVVRLFTNPYYFRFKADYTLRLGSASLKGKGIFEMMLLRGKHTIRDN